MALVWHRSKRINLVRGGAFGALILLLSACAIPQSAGPGQTTRQAIETAPADLQLACASEAQSRIAPAGETILPVRSERINRDTFRVELTSRSAGASCEITRTGIILALDAVPPIEPAPSPAG